jgi:polyisoprenoid-binding protein YceI
MRRILFLLAGMFVATAVHAADACIVPARSHFRINVGTAGLFGAFAHNHLIEARNIDGCANIDTKNPSHSSIKLAFATADIKVIDPKESAKDRAEVQKTMETEVLRISEHPRVTFASTSVEPSDSGKQLRVKGNLTIRGKTQPVVVPLTLTRLDDGTYRAVGKYSFKQTAFGIKPISLAGGTVKVKDEVETEFEIFLK